MIRNQLAFAQLPPVARRRGAFAFGLALCTLGLSFSASAQSIFTTFDVPGSVQTIPISINSKGAVIGLYTDQNFVGHGFLRSPGGIFTTIDPPGSVFTVAQSINSAGAITGAYIDATFTFHAYLRGPDGTFNTFENAANGFHGFLRTPDGTITEFNAPGAAKGTSALSINSVGTITGFYIDANGVIHGFLRSVPGRH